MKKNTSSPKIKGNNSKSIRVGLRETFTTNERFRKELGDYFLLLQEQKLWVNKAHLFRELIYEGLQARKTKENSKSE